ncbi:hypothetical protein LCGC14_0422750 [marine sediment metagenome]|uniref:Uncharacterized protein n=1 Tax=marine sediment metagenome TaxID=412755 RepID=A0A0F9T8D5_9ZZZZ
MKISKLCQECTLYRVKTCVGRDKVKLGKLPCKNYELDPQLISDQDIEPDSKPPSLKDRKPEVVRPLVPDVVLPTNKVKAANFTRLATQRLTKTLDDMRKLGNLSARGNYEWESEQIAIIASRLHGAVDDFEKKFQK